MERDLVERLIAELRQLKFELESSEQNEKSSSSPPEVRGDVDQAQWLAGILAHSPDVISVLDLDGTLLYLSRAARGRDPAPYFGKNSADFVPPPSRQLWEQAVHRAATGRGPQQVEVFSTGDYYWDTRIVPIETDGKVTWLLSIGRDVTAQRGTEAALALKEEQLKLALQASGMGQWSWDIAQDKVTWDNAMKKIFNWPEDDDDIDLAAVMERVHPADRDRVQKLIAASIETGQYRDIQCRIVLPDASVRWVFSKGGVVKDAEGQAKALIGGLMDITHGKRTEEQLQRSAKLEAIGQLAGGIAHDFNNLLVAILGNLDLAKNSGGKLERDQSLTDAAEAATRAAELTRQLLVFSRRQPLDQAKVDCHELIEDTLRLLVRLLPETIELELIRAHRLPYVFGDRGQLEQVIVNLCLNARDAMPKGGKLIVETEVVLVNGRFRDSHPMVRPGRYVLLTVTDTGCGIPPDQLDHIFEPFFTTKEQGTGLGLASAYGVVKQHGGLLHVYSEVDKGTTFKVYLPVAERSASDVGSKVTSPVLGGTETVLLAEDESAVRAVVARTLERAGYRVITVEDGQQAVDRYLQHQNEIAILVFDVVMPQKGGNEALAEIRELTPGIPAVLCSGYSEAPDTLATTSEILEFLPKPYEPDALLRAIRRMLDRHRKTEAVRAANPSG